MGNTFYASVTKNTYGRTLNKATKINPFSNSRKHNESLYHMGQALRPYVINLGGLARMDVTTEAHLGIYGKD